MTGASDTKPIWPDRMPNVNVNAKIIGHSGVEYHLGARKMRVISGVCYRGPTTVYMSI